MMRHVEPVTDRAGVILGTIDTLAPEAADGFGGIFLSDIQPLLNTHAVLSIAHRGIIADRGRDDWVGTRPRPNGGNALSPHGNVLPHCHTGKCVAAAERGLLSRIRKNPRANHISPPDVKSQEKKTLWMKIEQPYYMSSWFVLICGRNIPKHCKVNGAKWGVFPSGFWPCGTKRHSIRQSITMGYIVDSRAIVGRLVTKGKIEQRGL